MDLSVHEEEIAIPLNNSFASNHGQPSSLHHHHLPSNGPPPPLPLLPPPPPPENHHRLQNHQNSSSTTKKAVVVKYHECLKNHAASIGGNATDGCGEFMPSGVEGTIEALKCSACNCHRNFHRKEAEGDQEGFSGRQKGLLIPRAPLHHWVMPLGALHSSESDHEVIMARPSPPSMPKKRFRTKFTADQKEKMLSFAERVGWRLQNLEDGVVQQFCQEIGVKRRVLKVWMHNNKHNLAKKTNSVDHDQLE